MGISVRLADRQMQCQSLEQVPAACQAARLAERDDEPLGRWAFDR
jgi:hypothetical protein